MNQLHLKNDHNITFQWFKRNIVLFYKLRCHLDIRYMEGFHKWKERGETKKIKLLSVFLLLSLVGHLVWTFYPANLLKKRLWHRFFPVSFAKFPRTAFLYRKPPWLLLSLGVSQNFQRNGFSNHLWCFFHSEFWSPCKVIEVNIRHIISILHLGHWIKSTIPTEFKSKIDISEKCSDRYFSCVSFEVSAMAAHLLFSFKDPAVVYLL